MKRYCILFYRRRAFAHAETMHGELGRYDLKVHGDVPLDKSSVTPQSTRDIRWIMSQQQPVEFREQ